MTACATGIRAAAPALVFHADAVMPAARRSGISTPCAPKPDALRTTAPRLRGSVTESRATMSGGSPCSAARSSRSSGWAYSYAGILAASPWCTAPEVSRSSSLLVISSRPMPRSAGEPERLAQPPVALGALGDVHGGDGDAGPQRLDDRVAAGDPLGLAARGPATRPGGGGLVGLGVLLVDLVVGAVLGLRRRALALEAALDAAPGAGRRLLGRSCGSRLCVLSSLASTASLPRGKVHTGPAGVSSTSIPAALIWSRIWSARAQSLAARASARWVEQALDEDVDRLGQPGVGAARRSATPGRAGRGRARRASPPPGGPR